MTDFASRLKALTSEPSRDTPADPHRLARVERTGDEMTGQGAAIRATLAAASASIRGIAERADRFGIDRIVIAGCGDSWFAGAAVRHALETMTGLPVEAAQALDFAVYGSSTANARTLAIGISSGGNTPAVMRALQAASAHGAFAVGISNTPDSPILTQFDAGLIVHATRKGWPTQSTSATMALITALGAELRTDTGDATMRDAIKAELSRLPDTMDRLCHDLDTQMRRVAERFAASGLMLFAGLGPNFAAAAIGAAKVRELSPIHAYAIPLEEYHHYRSQKAGDPLFLLATDPASAERALDTALVGEAVGGRIVAVLSEAAPDIEARVEEVVRIPATLPALTALLSIVPLHLFAYHFAKARAALQLGAPQALPSA
jgi:glucosamine--fructose-6-phosphate aminotransferase (isomerizing)